MNDTATVAMLTAMLSAVVQAAVTWGVISTKLAWIRKDIEDLRDRVDHLDENRQRLICKNEDFR